MKSVFKRTWQVRINVCADFYQSPSCGSQKTTAAVKCSRYAWYDHEIVYKNAWEFWLISISVWANRIVRLPRKANACLAFFRRILFKTKKPVFLQWESSVYPCHHILWERLWLTKAYLEQWDQNCGESRKWVKGVII